MSGVRLSVRVRRAIPRNDPLFELGGRPMKKHGEHHTASDEPAGDTISNFHLATSIKFSGNPTLNHFFTKWFRPYQDRRCA